MMLAGEPLDVTVQEATLTMGENMHDTGTITVTSTERTNTDGILEQPISFLYGSAPSTEVFCGYVTEVTEAADRHRCADVDDGRSWADQADADGEPSLLDEPHDPQRR